MAGISVWAGGDGVGNNISFQMYNLPKPRKYSAHQMGETYPVVFCRERKQKRKSDSTPLVAFASSVFLGKVSAVPSWRLGWLSCTPAVPSCRPVRLSTKDVVSLLNPADCVAQLPASSALSPHRVPWLDKQVLPPGGTDTAGSPSEALLGCCWLWHEARYRGLKNTKKWDSAKIPWDTWRRWCL